MSENNLKKTIINFYEENLAGLPYPITLVNTAIEIADTTGYHIGTSIPDAEGMTRALAIALCKLPVALIGKEVSFIRKATRLSEKGFANALDINLSLLALWETGLRDNDFDYPDSRLRYVASELLCLGTNIGTETFLYIRENRLPLYLRGKKDPSFEVRRERLDGTDNYVWIVKLAVVFHDIVGGSPGTESNETRVSVSKPPSTQT